MLNVFALRDRNSCGDIAFRRQLPFHGFGSSSIRLRGDLRHRLNVGHLLVAHRVHAFGD